MTINRFTVVLLYFIGQGLAGCADDAPPARSAPVIAKPAAPVAVPEQAQVTVVPAPEPRGFLSEAPIHASSESVQPASQMNPESGPTVIMAPEPLILPNSGAEHRFQIAAERFAKDEACSANPQASLQVRAPGVEVYAVPCVNGDALLVRCEFGNCREMQ